jgi:beta-lactamase regulating signal transducer with metallopeptidase domain
MTVTAYLISKVTLATGIAVAAEGVRRCARRVALAYTLWAMVLVVLLVPPVFVVPVPAWMASHLGANSRIDSSGAVAPYLTPTAVLIWLIGGGIVLWRRARHVRLVERLVRFAASASPAVSKQCALIARELGLRTCPLVVTAGGAFSPFLWHPLFGRPRIVLPTKLLDRLPPDSIAAILRHELVHLRRRDAWRHRAELLVLMLWWWLPTTWLACRRLRELEELCTDTEVLRSHPQGANAYGRALLDTEEFLSRSRASRMGFVLAFTSPGALKTRITAIAAFAPSGPIQQSRLPAYGLVAVSVALGLSVAGSVSNQPNGVPLAQAANAAIDKPVLQSEQLEVPTTSHSGLASIGPPDKNCVTVRHAAHEIVLSWPGESPLAATHVIRLVKVSTADVSPPLWRIDGDRLGTSARMRLHSRQLEWIFAFLGADDVVIDEEGTPHSHPGAMDVSAA